MLGVFISYRRSETSAYAGRLFDILSVHFGRKNIFMDLDSIEGGDEFSTVIEKKIAASDVLIALIGSQWLTVTGDKRTRRLDDPRDFVRLEIGTALKRGARVIPVLVGGASIPRAEDLPADLRKLCDRQAIDIRDAHFHPDAEQLVKVLRESMHRGALQIVAENKKVVLPLAAVIMILATVLLLRFFMNRSPASPLHQASDAAAKPSEFRTDFGGKWKATVKYDWGDTYEEIFTLETDGQELSGAASFLGGRRGGSLGILDGKIVGNRISFMTKSLTSLNGEETSHQDKHYYKGTAEGDVIRFTMMTDSDIESHAPVHFTATRVRIP